MELGKTQRLFLLLTFFFSSVLARSGSRILQSLTPEERAASVNTLADLLITKQSQILEANAKDLEEATKSGLAKPLLSRLSLTPAKLKSLSTGLKQIADSSLQVCGFLMLSGTLCSSKHYYHIKNINKHMHWAINLNDQRYVTFEEKRNLSEFNGGIVFIDAFVQFFFLLTHFSFKIG